VVAAEATIATGVERGRGGRFSNWVVHPAVVPVVLVAAALMLAAVVSKKAWAVDFLHVVCGAAWTTVDLFMGFVIGPIMGRMPIPARMELSKRLMPVMLVLMPTLVVGTLVGGWQLAGMSGNLDTSSQAHPYVVAAVVVVAVMALIALAILEPANLVILLELRRPQPRGEIIGTLMKRFIYTSGVTGAMQVATLILMTRLATLH
jgi:hypothetical protein